MLETLSLLALLTASGPLPVETPGDQLAPPKRLESAGKPIDVEVGHAAPFICDFDGDGLLDLLVGQFGDGKLRIYRNEGTCSKPRYRKFSLFVAGVAEGRVPTG